MCIIAYKPVNELFNKNEVERMWNTNPDGAGVAVRNPETKRVIFKKGMMDKRELLEVVDIFNKKELELVIHCRITSRGITNEKQTHPFKSQNIKSMGHINVKGDLYFMNGTITELEVKKGYNDTMTFIEYMQLNKVKPTQELIDTIGDVTGARWLCVSKEGIFYTSDFIKHDKKFYSNRNHVATYSTKKRGKKNRKKSKSYKTYKSSYYTNTKIEDTYSESVVKKIKKAGIYDELKEFIELNCDNLNCGNCFDCILTQNDVKYIKEILEEYNEYRIFNCDIWDE